MRCIYIFSICCLLSLWGCKQQEERPQLIIYAAASLTSIITEMGEAFSKQNDVTIQYNFASSGALARQLIAKTQADIYLSANIKWMDLVDNAGRLIPNSRNSLLSNHLVIVSQKDATFELTEPNALSEANFTYCTIGDPSHVPVGQYAQKWLESIEQWHPLQGRISLAPDARSVIAQVSHNKNLIGIVYYSDYLIRRDDLQILYTLPADEGPRIEYQVARIQSPSHSPAAIEFINYLRSEPSAATFEALGFSVIDSKTD